MQTSTAGVDDQAALFAAVHPELDGVNVFAHDDGVDVLLLIIHPNLPIFKRHENALHIFSLTHVHSLDISDLCRHLLGIVHAPFVVEGIEVSIHRADYDGLVQFDEPERF